MIWLSLQYHFGIPETTLDNKVNSPIPEHHNIGKQILSIKISITGTFNRDSGTNAEILEPGAYCEENYADNIYEKLDAL